MNTTEQLKELVKNNPATTVAIASTEIGVSKQRISQIAKKHGLKLRDGRQDKASNRDREWRNHWGSPEKLSSHFIGGASELIASADLLRRGIPVYRALTFLSSCDLIANVSGVLLRLEVRSARLKQDGRLAYASPNADRYDVIVLVDQDSNVTYRPKEGICWSI